MATREEIKSEVEKVPEERLEELNRIVKTFTQAAPTDAQHSNNGDDWLLLAQAGLAGAYGGDEPEYSLDLVKEPNPEYEGR